MCSGHADQWLSKCAALRNPVSTSQATPVLPSPVVHIGDSGRFPLRRDRCFLLKALQTTAGRVVNLVLPATHARPGQEGCRLRSRTKGLHPHRAPVSQNGVFSGGCTPLAWTAGFPSVCLSPLVWRKEGRLHVGPSEHSSQNSGVGRTLSWVLESVKKGL